MPPLSIKAPKWALTEDALQQLLFRLDPDSEVAAQQYEKLRLKLIIFFETRKASQPDILADEAINRLAQKISAGEVIQSLTSYALAVAKFIYLESQRRPMTVSLEDCRPEDDASVSQKHILEQQELESEALRSSCMRKCLAEMPEESRSLLIEYYLGNGRELALRRLKMADRMGLSPNALYIRVHRIREKLESQLLQHLNHK